MEFGRFAWLVLVVCFSLCFSSTQGYRFYVGGRDGWVLNPSENYNHWAERNRFQVNDTLYFKYKKGSDSVLVVNKDDFFKCNIKNSVRKLDGGDSEFTFDRSGPFYFISGQNGNCEKGQKLFIIVLAVRHKQPTAPPLPITPSPSPSTPTTPTSPAPSPSTPKSPSPQPQPPVGPVSPKPPSPSASPSPVTNPPASSPSPWSPSSPSPSTSPKSPVPAPYTNTPTTSPVPAPSSPLTPPTLSPPSPPPVGPTPTPSAGPSPPETVASPPPGSADTTAPAPAKNGASHSVTPSSVLVSWVVLLASVALMSSFVQGGAL